MTSVSIGVNTEELSQATEEVPSSVPNVFPPTDNVFGRYEAYITLIYDGYCRLCATRTPTQGLRSFGQAGTAADSLLASIRLLNNGVRRGDGLPQVACLSCVQRLEMVDSFIRTIASAQTVLTAMFMPQLLNANLKTESTLTDSDRYSWDSDSETIGNIKREMGMKKREKRRKFKRKLCKDTSKTEDTTVGPESRQEHRVPIKSEDPNIRRWSDYFCCKRCNLKTSSLQQLREHSWRQHARCVVFKCVECPGQITSYKRFVRHMIKHQRTLEQCCELCDQTFINAWEVIVHKGLEHTGESKPFKCTRCGTTFDTQEELQNHQDAFVIVKSKGAGERRLKCQHCDKVFLNYITLQSHLEVHDPTKNMCTICNKPYKNKYTLSQHNEFVHSDRVRFICQMCGKGFKVKQHLKRHIDVHNDVRNYPCDKCEKRFRSPAQLKSHQSCHSDESLFSCHLCSKSYKFRAGLRDHLRAHNNERPYACDSCDRTFLSWSNYNKHMKAIHKKNMARAPMII